jgi:hypothetical protein
MPRRDVEDEDDWNDVDPQAPDDADIDDEADDDTIECPHCGRDVYEAAQRCPHCGNYLSEEDAPRRATRRPWWILLAAALALLAVMTWVLR